MKLDFSKTVSLQNSKLSFFKNKEFSKVKAFIGLGNPGPKFFFTRHNVGFLLIDFLAKALNKEFSYFKENEYFEHSFNLQEEDPRKVIFIKPMTFMNNSGDIVSFIAKKGIKPEEVLVIHDELEKPLGSIGVRFSGSERGHNGLKSLALKMSKNFWRIRVGIGRPEKKENVHKYVLEKFSKSEEAYLEVVLDLFEKFMEL